MAGLGDLSGGSFNSVAYDASADGATIVGYGVGASGTEAFRWTSANGLVGLGDLPGGSFFSLAQGISADGSTIVGYSKTSSGNEAFRWTSSGGMVGLGDLPGGGFGSVATDVSADGSIVVGYGTPASGGGAFIWDAANGMRSLNDVLTAAGVNPTGWQLFEATGVSDDGRYITGYGLNPSASRGEAWLVDLGAPAAIAAAPEPISLFVWTGLATTASTIAYRRRHPAALALAGAMGNHAGA
jgi:probable HAF family extracellular repeat protein